MWVSLSSFSDKEGIRSTLLRITGTENISLKMLHWLSVLGITLNVNKEKCASF